MSTTSPCSGYSRRPEWRRSGATRTPQSRRGRLGGASIEVCYEITAVVGGVRTVFVQAETTIVLLDAESGRPRRVTEAEREVWRRYSGPPVPWRRRRAGVPTPHLALGLGDPARAAGLRIEQHAGGLSLHEDRAHAAHDGSDLVADLDARPTQPAEPDLDRERVTPVVDRLQVLDLLAR